VVTEPTPVRCPAPLTASEDGGTPLDPLLARLADPAPPTATETFPRGTLQPDGRLDLCKQQLSAADARRVIGAAAGAAHARHLLLGTNSLGAAGIAALADQLTAGHTAGPVGCRPPTGATGTGSTSPRTARSTTT
jgi:hypothetical protein